MKQLYKKFRLWVPALVILLTGCSMLYRPTGDTLIGYAQDKGVPFMLATEDVALSCAMAESFTPFLLSFASVTDPPDKLGILLHLIAGNCIEFKAWEEELRYLRALHDKRPIEARDARIAQQRLLAQAAQRQLTGYRHFTRVYAIDIGEQCPEFANDDDEFYWLVGLVTGIQAIINDISSGGYQGVPLSIAGKVGRGASCLQNEKWWGAPAAIEAAIGIIIPENGADKQQPLRVLQKSLSLGLEQGIYLTQVLAAQVYLGQGQNDKVREIIREHVTVTAENHGNRTYRILNEVAKLQIRAISDRMWTEATGQRTPLGKIGHFWDETAEATDIIDIDEILE